jgi:hypothetical protein
MRPHKPMTLNLFRKHTVHVWQWHKSSNDRKSNTLFFVQETPTPLNLILSQPIGYTSSSHSTFTSSVVDVDAMLQDRQLNVFEFTLSVGDIGRFLIE